MRHITDLEPGTGQWAAATRQLLLDSCASAGVELGSFDREVLAWPGNFEPWVVASIAGLIERAAVSATLPATGTARGGEDHG